MNRFLSVFAVVFLTATPAMGEQLFLPGMEPPQAVQPEVEEPTEIPSPADQAEGSLDWVDNFVDPEGRAPQVTEEELRNMVPALLTLERKVQHDTACQYWLKLENRLPFKIRNLAVRFSAYIMREGYDQPILFDTDIKSFSELRPTDVQYRDIFFEYANCDDLAYIKVDDAGRCAVGSLTKFSSQSGDCARFIDVADSEEICIYLDTSMLNPAAQGAGQPVAHPCGVVMQADVDSLLEQFEISYETGDLESFLTLFDVDAEAGEAKGSEQITNKYNELFEQSGKLDLELRNISWEASRNGGAVIKFDKVVMESEEDASKVEESVKPVTLKVAKRDDETQITSIEEGEVDEGPALFELFDF